MQPRAGRRDRVQDIGCNYLRASGVARHHPRSHGPLLVYRRSSHTEAETHEKNEIPSRAATGIGHFHSRNDPPAQQLIEQVDVDVSELFTQDV
jgi:hypothetical protein